VHPGTVLKLHAGEVEESLQQRIERLGGYADAGELMPAGRLLGLPELPNGDVWIDMAGAAVVTGSAPHTITGWLRRGGPKYCPFPRMPKMLYQMYWPLSEVAEWHDLTAWIRQKAGTPVRLQP
jgi:hypothetical protein